MSPLSPVPAIKVAAGAVAAAVLAAGCVPNTTSESTRSQPAAAAGGGATLLVEPDDGPAPVLAFLRGAQRSLAVEVYLLTDDEAIQALVDLRRDGREVQVILEPHPFGADGANQPTFDRLAAAGVAVAWASPRFALTHTKAMVADGRRALIASLNLTRAGLRGNREYLIADDAPADVGAVAAILAADRLGTASAPPLAASRLIASPINARARLLELIGGAHHSLAVEIEELSDPQAVAAIAGAVARGVAVSAVVPGTGRSTTTQAAVIHLVEAGAAVRALLAPTVHAKAIVADGARLYVGSVNLTAASLDDNREIGVLLDDATLAARVARTIAGDWARAGEL
ncbi:MAG TPA: phospholipase D-like domain-containing protein [Polyangia bacterium]|nr:phospholipase D-like domain-containing protein [Polyangia bacterium]